MTDIIKNLVLAKARYADSEQRVAEARRERDAAWATLQEAFTKARNRQDSAG